MVEIAIATAHGEEDEKLNGRQVTVHVKHLGEHEKENFKVKLSDTLQEIWDQSYLELKIEKQDRDVFQAPRKKDNPLDLTPHLGLSLKAAQDQDLCEDDFEIAARTGGA